ncbi:MAG: alpha/beta fold hydrolase, partial [Solirubrobacterales bacterium]
AAPAFLPRGAGGLALLLPRLAARRETIVKRPGLRKLFLSVVAAHPDKLRSEIAFELIGGAGKLGFVAATQAIFAHDFRENLGGIACPTLIVWGEKDRLVGARDADRFAGKIPGSTKMILADTGHLAMVERPAWFNATVRDYLLAS